MTITELKYIVALAKAQHFGRAAQSVFVSQPTLSIGIKKLEQELGIAIFERLSNKVVPTQVGQRIIAAAQETLMSTDIIRSIAAEAKGELTGDVKLGAIYTMCPYLLPKMIPDLQQHAPDVRLYVKEDYTNNLMEALKNGDLDVAIVSLPLPESDLFAVKSIDTEDFYVIMPNHHPLTEKTTISPEDLSAEQVFLLGGGNCFRDQVVQACPGCLGGQSSEPRLIEGGSLNTIAMMVAGGLGISVFPAMAVPDEPQITVRPFTKPVPKRHIALAWRKSFTQQSLIDAIEASMLRCSRPFLQQQSAPNDNISPPVV